MVRGVSDQSKAIEVKVPIQVIGIPVGVKLEGGLMDHVVREVSVSCLPADIPEVLQLDASDVHVGQHLSIRDIKVTDKIKILDDLDQTVIVIALPKAEEVAAATPAEGAPAEGASAEPEVIKKGKETAGEDETPAKGGDAKKAGGDSKKKEGGKG